MATTLGDIYAPDMTAGIHDGGGDMSSTLAGSDASEYNKNKFSWFDPSKILGAQQQQGQGDDGRSILQGGYLASILNPISGLSSNGPGSMGTYYQNNGGGDVQAMQEWNPGTFSFGDQTLTQGVSPYNTHYSSQADWQQAQGDLAKQYGLDPTKNYAYSTFTNPTGNGNKDVARGIYSLDSQGNATPVGALNNYSASSWVSGGRDFVRDAAILGTLGYGASAAAGAGAGGAGTAGSTLGANAPAGFGAGAYDFGAGTGASFGAGSGGATLAGSNALGAGIGGVNAGLGTSGFSLAGMGNSALKGAGVNAGSTALQGGNLKDVLKSAGYGAVGGALGYGVGTANPGSYVTDNPGYQSIINRGVTGGVNAGLTGGNIGQGALWGAGTQAGNVAGGAAWNSLTSPNVVDNGGGSMPDYGMSSAGGGSPVADWFNNNTQQSYAPQGWSSSPEVNTALGTNTDNSLFNPDFSYTGGGDSLGASAPPPQQQQTSAAAPWQDLLKQALGFGGGASGGTPHFGDMAGSLLGMYSAYQQKKKYGDMANNLASMYGPNSPYAQQLQQQLMRRDAAAGRRSQYGPRSVELQARLADVNSRMAPTLQSLYGAQGGQNNALLNNALRFGQQSGLTGAISNYAEPWINSLFNQTPPNSGPQFGE